MPEQVELSEKQADSLVEAQRRAQQASQQAQQANQHLQEVFELIVDANGIEADLSAGEVQLNGQTLIINTSQQSDE